MVTSAAARSRSRLSCGLSATLRRLTSCATDMSPRPRNCARQSCFYLGLITSRRTGRRHAAMVQPVDAEEEAAGGLTSFAGHRSR